MTTTPNWRPETYDRFRGLRLRPARDLLAQVPDLPEGPVVDLGCGTGAMAADLAGLGRSLIGVDNSPEMIAEAVGYDTFQQVDIAQWQAKVPPALIFSNAALHWLDDHDTLMPRLVDMLAPKGVLAVQMPRQEAAPSHRFLRDIAARMFPDRFAIDVPPRVAVAVEYADLLSPLGKVEAWETEYIQLLPPVEDGHPIRHFTQGAAMLPFVQPLTEEERADFVAAYDAALAAAYPRRADGSVFFPFRRCFFVLRRD